MSLIAQMQQEMQFTEEYRWVLEAMKQVAAAELRGMERQRLDMKILKKELHAASEVLKAAQPKSILFQTQETAAGAIILTSDAGFVGDLNIRVVRAALAKCLPGQDTLHVIGEQGVQILKEQACRYSECATLAQARGSVQKIRSAVELLARKYRTGQLGGVLLVYPVYRSMGRQDVGVETLLPLNPQPLPPPAFSRRDVVLESSVSEIEQEIARNWMEMWVKDAVWNTKISELAARVVHLEGALDELGRQKHAAVLQYFRAVHEEMDRGIREIYASRLFTARRPRKPSGAV